METLTGLPPLSYGVLPMFDGSACRAGNSAAAGQDAAVELGSSVNVRFPCRRALWLCPLRYTSTKLSERPQVKRLFDICNLATLSSCAGSTGSAATTATFPTPSATSCVRAWSSRPLSTPWCSRRDNRPHSAGRARRADRVHGRDGTSPRQSPRRRLSRAGRKPSFNRKLLDDVNRMLTTGTGASAISKATGLTRQAVLRIKANPVAAERALKVWGM